MADILAKTYTMIKAIKFKGGDSTIPETIDHIRVEADGSSRKTRGYEAWRMTRWISVS